MNVSSKRYDTHVLRFFFHFYYSFGFVLFPFHSAVHISIDLVVSILAYLVTYVEYHGL